MGDNQYARLNPARVKYSEMMNALRWCNKHKYKNVNKFIERYQEPFDREYDKLSDIDKNNLII